MPAPIYIGIYSVLAVIGQTNAPSSTCCLAVLGKGFATVKYANIICIVLCCRLLSNRSKKSRKRVRASTESMQYPVNLLQYTANALVVDRFSVKKNINKRLWCDWWVSIRHLRLEYKASRHKIIHERAWSIFPLFFFFVGHRRKHRTLYVQESKQL